MSYKSLGVTALAAGLTALSYGALQNRYPDEGKITAEGIRNSPVLAYFSDSLGNQDGTPQPKETMRLEREFGDNQSLFFCMANPLRFYGGREQHVFKSLTEAKDYWDNNRVRGPQSIVEVDNSGDVRAMYILGKDKLIKINITEKMIDYRMGDPTLTSIVFDGENFDFENEMKVRRQRERGL